MNTRRAKFIALSELTEDYLDTTGALSAFEGELESGNLISMIVEMGQFSFTSGTTIQVWNYHHFYLKCHLFYGKNSVSVDVPASSSF